MGEYISIREFAERAGITRQAVYLALSSETSKLSSYCQVIDKQKKLNVKALYEIYGVEGDKKTDKELDSSDKLLDNLSATVETLQKQLEMKDRQLEEKDKQIESLHRIMEQQNTLALAEKGVMFQLTEGGTDPADPQPQSKTKKWFQFWR